ncbi:MAG: hypothetical protein JXR96_11415 [Deltaproteobacteria bacterium]|nr:hypothetical protein [Deltaproteobacteria bacterium]
MTKIGIRKEDKNIWERRSPLVPAQVRRLVEQEGLSVQVESSSQRVFADQAFRDAGAEITDGIPDAPVVFAVKEIPVELLSAGKTYVFFAHVIKGQAHNMPMLRRLLALGCTLIDYEKVADEQGRRLIFFGRHAGLAGMLDTLWALGQRLREEGFDTPLARIQTAHSYPDLKAASQAVSEVGDALRQDGLPEALQGMVIGLAGYGNVSRGAQEILDQLGPEQVEPEQLESLAGCEGLVKVVFKEQHMVVPRDARRTFDLQDYFAHPERYRGVFARHVPRLHALVNCIYWTPDYPRLVSRDLLWGLYAPGCSPRLRVIGDISCDIEGAIECTLEPSDPGEPVYVYLPEADRIEPGLAGRGPVVMAVDNLPCELPRESSEDFGQALLPYAAAIARADYGASFDDLDLPPAIKQAVICHRGELTPAYKYLEKHLT